MLLSGQSFRKTLCNFLSRPCYLSRPFASCASQYVPLIVSNHLHPHLHLDLSTDRLLSRSNSTFLPRKCQKEERKKKSRQFLVCPSSKCSSRAKFASIDIRLAPSAPSLSSALCTFFSSRFFDVSLSGILSSNAQARNDCFAVKTTECTSKGDTVTRLTPSICGSTSFFLLFPSPPVKLWSRHRYDVSIFPSCLENKRKAARSFFSTHLNHQSRRQPAGILFFLSQKRFSLFTKNHSCPLANVIICFSQAFQVLGDANPMTIIASLETMIDGSICSSSKLELSNFFLSSVSSSFFLYALHSRRFLLASVTGG